MSVKVWNKLSTFMEEFLTNNLVDEEDVANTVKAWNTKKTKSEVLKILNGPKPRRKKDPNKPKGAKSSYLFYCAEVRDKVKKEHPDEKVTDIGRRCGKMWKALSEAKKAKYVKLAQEDRERYTREMKDYTPPETEAKNNKNTKSKKKGVKGPRTSYILYCEKERPKVKEENLDMKTTDVTKKLAAQWNSLPEEEKTFYKDLARKDRERYVAECNQTEDTKEDTNADTKENKEEEETVKKGEDEFLQFSTKLRVELKKEHPKWGARKLTREIQNRWKEQHKTATSTA